jgi:Mg2+/Co2+ transporter CorB
MTTEEIVWWVVLVAGLAGTAIYSGVETGLYCLNRVRLRLRVEKGPRQNAARTVEKELREPERMRRT